MILWLNIVYVIVVLNLRSECKQFEELKRLNLPILWEITQDLSDIKHHIYLYKYFHNIKANLFRSQSQFFTMSCFKHNKGIVKLPKSINDLPRFGIHGQLRYNWVIHAAFN